MPDKNITCVDCKAEFVFTEGEQTFFKSKGLTNEPKRCGPCRAAKKERNNDRDRRPSGKDRY